GSQGADQLECLEPVAGLTDHLEIRLSVEDRCDRRAEQRLVIDQEQANGVLRRQLAHSPTPLWTGAPRAGNRSRTLVPSPGRLSTCTPPPTRAARSAMVRRPKWRRVSP